LAALRLFERFIVIFLKQARAYLFWAYCLFKNGIPNGKYVDAALDNVLKFKQSENVTTKTLTGVENGSGKIIKISDFRTGKSE
jgi:hypothetical protein